MRLLAFQQEKHIAAFHFGNAFHHFARGEAHARADPAQHGAGLEFAAREVEGFFGEIEAAFDRFQTADDERLKFSDEKIFQLLGDDFKFAH